VRGEEYNKDEGGGLKMEIVSLRPAFHLILPPEHLEMSLKSWIKKIGFWGLIFFLVKGLLWLTIPALIAIFAAN
jgi:hypothetical protein